MAQTEAHHLKNVFGRKIPISLGVLFLRDSMLPGGCKSGGDGIVRREGIDPYPCVHHRNGRQVDANVAHVHSPLVAQEKYVGVDLIRRRRNGVPFSCLAKSSIFLKLLPYAGLSRKGIGTDLISDQEQTLTSGESLQMYELASAEVDHCSERLENSRRQRWCLGKVLGLEVFRGETEWILGGILNAMVRQRAAPVGMPPRRPAAKKFGDSRNIRLSVDRASNLRNQELPSQYGAMTTAEALGSDSSNKVSRFSYEKGGLHQLCSLSQSSWANASIPWVMGQYHQLLNLGRSRFSVVANLSIVNGPQLRLS